MFQLLGIGLVGGAKTRFGREKKIRRAPLTIFRFRTPFFIVSIVSSIIRLLGNVGWRETVHLIIYSAADMKNARHFQSCPN